MCYTSSIHYSRILKSTMIQTDEHLEEQIRKLILSKGRYLTCTEILTELQITGTRSYLSYRGIDVTAINLECGFTRREAKECSLKTEYSGWTKESLETHVKSMILEKNRYVPEVEFVRIRNGVKLGPHLTTFKVLNVSVHELNLSLGFNKSNPKIKVNKTELETTFKEYILKKGRYVSQQEFVEKFGVSLSYLTKSEIDTLSLNYELGYRNGFSYMESIAFDAFVDFGIREVVRQKTFDDCVSKHGIKLRFDFFLPEYNLLVELDGPQHNDTNHAYWSEDLVNRDLIKDRYCISTGHNLVRIPWVGRDKTSAYIKQRILETLESLPNHNVIGNDSRDGSKIDEIRQPAAELRIGEGSTSSESVAG